MQHECAVVQCDGVLASVFGYPAAEAISVGECPGSREPVSQ